MLLKSNILTYPTKPEINPLFNFLFLNVIALVSNDEKRRHESVTKLPDRRQKVGISGSNKTGALSGLWSSLPEGDSPSQPITDGLYEKGNRPRVSDKL